jgi:hypothetical protein
MEVISVIGISDEFEESDFGDKRLKSISEAFVRNSENSILESFESWSEIKSAYRFMSNPKITREEILRSRTNNTMERVKEPSTGGKTKTRDFNSYILCCYMVPPMVYISWKRVQRKAVIVLSSWFVLGTRSRNKFGMTE